MPAATSRFVLALFAAVLLSQSLTTNLPAQQPQPKWWKGNLHTHTLWSDGNDFPEMIADWYAENGYHFLTLSDHNILSEGERWMKVDQIVKRGGKEALAKYVKRFGDHWVETRGKPGTPEHEVRLKPLNEFRTLVEQKQRFLMIPSEEISDQSEGRPVHMNAANLRELLPPVGGRTVREAIANNLRATREQENRIGRPIMLHLNHPNFGYAVTAEDMAAVAEQRFFEVYNGHPGINHLGDKNHPGVERLWDISSVLRIDQFATPPMYGVATDDSHNYHGRGGSRRGRGWVYVRSVFLTPEHLIEAMRRGDFYGSSGVELEQLQFDGKRLELKIKAEPGVTYETRFIGTLSDYDKSSRERTDAAGKPIRSTRIYSDEIGKTLAVSESTEPSYTLTGKELYVRAVVTASKAATDPSFPGQQMQAWTQPVGWQSVLKK